MSTKQMRQGRATLEAKEKAEKADKAIRDLVKMVYDLQTIVKSSTEMMEIFISNLRSVTWRYGVSVNEDNAADTYADSLQNVVNLIRESAAEINNRELDWDFEKPPA
jgi:hypothetical protein